MQHSTAAGRKERLQTSRSAALHRHCHCHCHCHNTTPASAVPPKHTARLLSLLQAATIICHCHNKMQAVGHLVPISHHICICLSRDRAQRPNRTGLQYRGIPTGQHVHPPLATQSLTHSVTHSLSHSLTHTASCPVQRVKWQHKAAHSPPSSAEVQNAWSNTSIFHTSA